MQVSVETTGGLERRMTVQVPAEQLDQQVQSKLQQLAHSVRLDGFRPGKVPFSVVKKRYGAQVRAESAGELIASTYAEALQQENLKPVGDPNIEQTRNQPGEELEYVATFEVFPQIEPPQLDDITIERPVAEVSDGDLDQMLDKLRRQRATWNTVDRTAASGDRLEIDFEGTIDGQPFNGNSAQNVPLELGSGAMIPGFEEQLEGVSAGDERTLEVDFPADYGSAEVAGKNAKFQVKVNSVSEAALPELDDEFAKAFGMDEGGLDKLRAEIRSNMERELAGAVKSAVKGQVFDALLDNADLDVPRTLISNEIEALSKKTEEGANAAAAPDQLENEARRRVSLGLLIAEIIQRNSLQVDPEKVRQTIEEMAQAYEKPEEVVQWYYSNQEMLTGVQTMVMEETVVEWVLGQAKVEDKSTSFDEIMQS